MQLSLQAVKFESRFSAEKWLAKFSHDLVEFEVKFRATDPCSVWVRLDNANDFYNKSLKARGSKAYRTRDGEYRRTSPATDG